MRRHLHQSHASCKDEWNDPTVISSWFVEANELSNKNSTDGPVETLVEDKPGMVLSSDVVANEQQITLGKNAFILEDGTIVQPQGEDSVMIYVLDQHLTKT